MRCFGVVGRNPQSSTNPLPTPQIFCVSTENVGFRMLLFEVVTECYDRQAVEEIGYGI